MVDLQVVLPRFVTRLLGVADRRREVLRLAHVGPGGQERDVEVVDAEAQRRQVVGREHRAGREVVVLAQRVGEPLPHHGDDAALVAEQLAHRERDQHKQDRRVEEQVAGLAEVATLGRDRVLRGVDPVAALAQDPRRLLEYGVRRSVHDPAARLGEPPEVARGARRPGAHAAPVDPQPRHDAADERDHQQDVDRREPHRVIDREQPEGVVRLRQRRVVPLPLGDGDLVDVALRHDRAGHRRQSEQEQQHQRGAHGRELAPGPAGELDGRQRGRLRRWRRTRGRTADGRVVGAGVRARVEAGRGHTATSKPPTQLRSSPTQRSQTPVTSSTPTSTSIAPPARVTQTW